MIILHSDPLVKLFLNFFKFVDCFADYVAKLVHIIPSVRRVTMVTNYLFKMWISVIALEAVMPLHDFLLKIFFELFEVSHNAA